METIETLGKYEIKRTLGRGAMGTVYEGWDPIIARRVAIKTVKIPEAEDAETEDQLARFRREAQAAGRLIHPNIVGVFDYGETSDIAYIVMEYVDGPPVKSLLDKQERFALPDIMRLMEDLLAGLQFSHERGVVHRDIKPANVMLTSEGQAKIADFGIARIESSSMTQAGTVLGTPAYMSPEQFMGQVVDKRSDIYSSGVLLYQLLTGERPFEGGLSAIMHKALNTEPPAPSHLSVTCPTAFDAVVRKAMAKRPEDRFQSATEFIQALRTAAAGDRTEDPALPGEATIIAPGASLGRPVPPSAMPAVTGQADVPSAAAPVRRSSALPVVVAAVLLVLLAAGGGAWFFMSRGAGPSRTAATAPATSTAPGAPSPAAADQIAAHPASNPQTPAQTSDQAPPKAPNATAPGQATGATQAAAQNQAASQSSPSNAASSATTGQIAPETAPPGAPQGTAAAPASTPPPQSSAAATIPPGNSPAPATASSASQQVAATSLQAIRRDVQQVLDGQRCATLSGSVQDSGTIDLAGIAGRSAADAVRQALAGRPLDWQVKSVDPYYCSALNVVHPIAAGEGPLGSQLRLGLAGGVTRLRDGQRILPQIVMPNFRGYLRVDYVAHDGGVMHLYPQVADQAQKVAADPSHSFAPGTAVKLGEASPGHPVWEVGEPYGTDMIIAVASSQPLFAQPRPSNVEAEGPYLRELQHAVDAARQRGERLVGAAITLDTLPKK